jgi:protocatechuate 3,4-dioxygenase beta subunit
LRLDEGERSSHASAVLRLVPTPWVYGHVSARLGADVRRARVHLGVGRSGPNGNAAWPRETSVAPDGHYAIRLWSAEDSAEAYGSGHLEDEYVVLVELEGYAPAVSEPFRAEDAATGLARDVEVAAGAELHGRVCAENGGRAVAGAKIGISEESNCGEPEWPRRSGPWLRDDVRATTGDDGTWVIRSLAPARYAVSVVADGFAREVRDVDVADTTTVDICLRRTLPITGVVLNPRGDPVAGAQVTVLAPQCPRVEETDSAGAFRFDPIREGDYEMDVEPPRDGESLSCRKVVVSAGVTDLQVYLDVAPTVSGRILDADGTPVVGVTLYARAEMNVSGRWPRARTDASGRFVLKSLMRGRYDVTLVDEGVTFEGVETGVANDLRLPGALAASGRLVMPSGRPVQFSDSDYLEARRLDADSAQPRVVLWTACNDDGVFRFRHMAPGYYEAGMCAVRRASLVFRPGGCWDLPPGTRLEAGRDAGTITAVHVEER